MAHEPTDEQLLAAWHRLRRAEWGPATFAGDKAAALRWALVRLEAQHPRGMRRPPLPSPPPQETTRATATEQAPRPRAADPRTAEAEPPHSPPRRTPARAEPATFDRKRLAAGERDDDNPCLF